MSTYMYDYYYYHYIITIIILLCLKGMTALMWAARKDVQSEALKELVFAGADLNIQTKQVYSYNII